MLIPDAMAAFYLGAFVFGVLFTIVSFVLGAGHAGDGIPVHGGDAAHFDLHDAGFGSHEAGVGGHDAALDSGPSPFNLQVLAAFVSFFGGVGYALSLVGALWGPLIFALALAGGAVGGGIIFLFLARVIYRAQTPWMRARDYELPGTIARVTSTIHPGGTGEVVFEKRSARRVEGARATDNREIPKGEEVVIVRYERGIAYVEPSSEFFR